MRACDGEVDAPILHLEFDRADGADAIDEEEGGVVHRVQSRANGGNVGGDAGGGLVMGGKDGLDLVLFVGGEFGGVVLDRHALAPVHLAEIDIEAQTLGHIDPKH